MCYSRCSSTLFFENRERKGIENAAISGELVAGLGLVSTRRTAVHHAWLRGNLQMERPTENGWPCILVEAAGIEPASASNQQPDLHT